MENAADSSYELYKAAFYVMQFDYYLKTKNYVAKRSELKKILGGKEAAILDMYEKWDALRNDRHNCPEDTLNLLERWSTEKLISGDFLK